MKYLIARLAFLLFFLSLSFVSPSALAALKMHVSFHTQNKPKPGARNVPLESRDTLDVILTDDYISTKSGGKEHIHDFKKRRHLIFNSTLKIFNNFSLFSNVGFRAFEFQNRQMMQSMGDVMFKGLTSNNSFLLTTADNENNLSVSPPGFSTIITESHNKKEHVFSSNNRQLARWSNNGVYVAAGDAKNFARFFLYSGQPGGHTKILKKLADGKFIPEKLVFTFNESAMTSTISIVVSNIQQIDPVSYNLDSYADFKNQVATNDVAHIIDVAEKLTPEAIAAAREKNTKEVEEAFRDRRTFDAFLAAMEGNLMGKQIFRFSGEQQSVLGTDPYVKKLISVLQAQTKEQLEASIPVFTELRSITTTKAYVVKLFEAGIRRRTGDIGSSEKLFLEVLQANPALAGAYKDMGDLFLSRYDTVAAWQFWDVGRKIAPDFPNFEAVNTLETKLINFFPEYF